MYFFLYNLVLILFFPFFVIFMLISLFFVKKWRKGILKKFGFYYQCPRESRIIFHCVSVGETLSAVPLIKRFSLVNPNTMVTVTTRTGFEVAKKNLENSVKDITFFPYDFPMAIMRFFNCFKPIALIIVETEIWPNLIFFAKKWHIPVIFVNGRISDRSFPNYLKFKNFFKNFLDYPFFLMQTDKDRERILALGAKPSQVFVTGNIKYDMEKERKHIDKSEFGIKEEDIVIIAGSTHKGEEEVVLDSFIELKRRFPKLKLILAPRHPERFQEVFSLVKQRGLSFSKRSSGDKIYDIFVLDTVGELFDFYGLADIAFVGGSLVNIGGHNILEPASYGIPVLFGPYMQNFKEISEKFLSSKAGILVDANNLTEELSKLIANKEERENIGQRAKKIVENNRGSLERTLKLIQFIVGR